MKPRFGIFGFCCRGDRSNLWTSIFIFCLWICINFQNLLCKTCYHIPDKRTVVLYRILTFIKCTHTWNNKLRFWANIVTMICGKWIVNNGCSYIIIDNFKHFNGKRLDIKKENLYQEVPEMMKFDHYRSSKNSGEWVWNSRAKSCQISPRKWNDSRVSLQELDFV